MIKALLSSILLSALILSCGKQSNNIENSTKEAPATASREMQIDSLHLEDSLNVANIVSAEYSSTILVFPEDFDKRLLDSIYAKEHISLQSYERKALAAALENKKEKYYAGVNRDLENYTPSFKQTWNENSHMKVFSKKDPFLTIKYSGDGFSGGAHGYYYEFYKVFNLNTSSTLQLTDIFTSLDEKIWNPILLKSFLRDQDPELLFEDKIPLNSNFYFDENHITFVYNQYEIAPYSSGVITIKIPFSEISQHLKPQFKKDLGLK